MTSKPERYHMLAREIEAVIQGEPSRVARMASASCLMAQAFPETYFWTGFYIVDKYKENELVIGPYQGTLGCLRIPFSRGVCGACASRGETIIVKDVHAFAGHIACDSQTRSEIVVPVFDGPPESGEELFAVLDVDSTALGSFDADDKAGLERICNTLLLGATQT